MNPKKRMLLIFVSAAVVLLLAVFCIYFATRANHGEDAPEVFPSLTVSSDDAALNPQKDGEGEDEPSPETNPSEDEKTPSGKPETSDSPSTSGAVSTSPSGSETSVSTIPPITPSTGGQKYTAAETQYLLKAREMAQKVNGANEKTQKLLDSFTPGEDTAASFDALAGEFGTLKKELSGISVPQKFTTAHQALSEAVGSFQSAASLFAKVARDRDVEALKEAEKAVEAGNSKIREGSALLSSY